MNTQLALDLEKEDVLAPAVLADRFRLPLSLAQVLCARGWNTETGTRRFLEPSLDHLGSPDGFRDMKKAVARLREAIHRQETIALYADRDVDGLTGLAILARSLRTLGAQVVWGSPLQGRGVERAVLETLAAAPAKVFIFIDCGSGDEAELDWLQAQGMDLIVADHHRLSKKRLREADGLLWIHPDTAGDSYGEVPAGSVMAFKLAHALWLSFLGTEDPARLDYFLFDHLDLLALGILADRMPVTGENRIFLWHGLRRLAAPRKTGLVALTRFFRLTPRTRPVSVREATWRLIPLLNAGGRLGRPEWTTQLLLTEDALLARQCIDELIALNSQRRDAQAKSLNAFEKAVLDQCDTENDPVLAAIAVGLEPAVTGLAAQALSRKYNRPVFLFVRQGEEAIGSARGTPDVDLYAWVDSLRDGVVKFGGHHGAVGLTVKMEQYHRLREHLLHEASKADARGPLTAAEPEAEVALSDLTDDWWSELQRLEPFGPGHPCPSFLIQNVDVVPVSRRKTARAVQKPLSPRAVYLKSSDQELLAEWDLPEAPDGAGTWAVVGYPAAGRKNEPLFKWMIQKAWRMHA